MIEEYIPRNISIGETSPLVMLLQKALQKANIYKGNIDKIFGKKTEDAVYMFSGKKYFDAQVLQMLLPYVELDYTIDFSYDVCIVYIFKLQQLYPIFTINSIGESVMGNKIPLVKIGKSQKKAIFVASTHANEWITTPLLVKFLEEYSSTIQHSEKIYSLDANSLFNACELSLVLMLNPDGVNLVTDSIEKSNPYYLGALDIQKRYPTIRFPDGWKANIQGIDLNLQFPARWEQAKSIKEEQGYISPAPRDFVGDYPLQAPEAIAIYDYILQNNFDILLTYHTQGEVIYWQFLNYAPQSAYELGQRFAKSSGYALLETPSISANAGLKDWYLKLYQKPRIHNRSR